MALKAALLTLILLLPHQLLSDKEMQYSVSRGRCVIAHTQQQQHLTTSSTRMCAFLCSQLSPCISWSYRTGICNVSESVQTLLYTNDTDCEWWSVLHELSFLAFWPMSSFTRTRNVASVSGYLDLHENQVMQYVSDAVSFTGEHGVNERFNVDQLASHCLNSFTLSVWVKVTNPSRGSMPLMEGLTMPSSFFTRFWLHPASTNVKVAVLAPESYAASPESLVTPNVWNHVAAVYDKQVPNLNAYVNGTRINATLHWASAVTSCVKFGTRVQIGAIARSAGHGRVFQGYMKCFGVSERALSDRELARLGQLCRHSNPHL